jgi:hypothetical protein
MLFDDSSYRNIGVYLVFSAFTSESTFLTGPVKFSVFFMVYYLSVDSHHRYKPAADVFRLISVPPGFPGPF